MALVVYELPHSPYCIPITRALSAAGVEFETVAVPNWDRRILIELTGGRYYQVPVLVHDDQTVFETAPDSQNVPRYIDNRFCSGRLFPKPLSGLHDIVIARLENEVEGVTFRLSDPSYIDSLVNVGERLMVVRHKERKFGAGCVEHWRHHAEGLMVEAVHQLRPFEAMLEQHAFLLGDAPVYADFLLHGILVNMTWKGCNSIPSSLPAMQRWHSVMGTFAWDA